MAGTVFSLKAGAALLLIGSTSAVADETACRSVNPQAEPEQSYTLCQSALTADPNLQQDHDVMSNLGLAARALGRLDESADALEKAHRLAPKDASTARMLAWTYRQQGAYRKAERLYTKVIKIDPHWQGWLSRCVVRSDMKKWNAAITDCEAALKRDPENPDTLFFLARALIFAGKPDRAEPHASKAVRLYPDEARMHAELIWSLRLMARLPEARAVSLEALRRFPDDAAIIDASEGL